MEVRTAISKPDNQLSLKSFESLVYDGRVVRPSDGTTGYQLTSQVSLLARNRGIGATYSYVVPEPDTIRRLTALMAPKWTEIRARLRMVPNSLKPGEDMDYLLSMMNTFVSDCRAIRFIPVRDIRVTEGTESVLDSETRVWDPDNRTPAARTIFEEYSQVYNQLIHAAADEIAAAGINPEEHSSNQWFMLPDYMRVSAPEAMYVKDFLLAHALARAFPGVCFSARDPIRPSTITHIRSPYPLPGAEPLMVRLMRWWQQVANHTIEYKGLAEMLVDPQSDNVIGIENWFQTRLNFITREQEGQMMHLIEYGAYRYVPRTNASTGVPLGVQVDRGILADLLDVLQNTIPALNLKLDIPLNAGVRPDYATLLHDSLALPERFRDYVTKGRGTMPFCREYVCESASAGKFNIFAKPVYTRYFYRMPAEERLRDQDFPDDRRLTELHTVANTGACVYLGGRLVPYLEFLGIGEHPISLDPASDAAANLHVRGGGNEPVLGIRTLRDPGSQIEYADVLLTHPNWLRSLAAPRHVEVDGELQPAQLVTSLTESGQSNFLRILHVLDARTAPDTYLGRDWKPQSRRDRATDSLWRATPVAAVSDIIRETYLTAVCPGVILPIHLNSIAGGNIRCYHPNASYQINVQSTESTLGYTRDLIVPWTAEIQDVLVSAPATTPRGILPSPWSSQSY